MQQTRSYRRIGAPIVIVALISVALIPASKWLPTLSHANAQDQWTVVHERPADASLRWLRIAVRDEDAGLGELFSTARRVPVTLPDRSVALIELDPSGQPSALLFPTSNSIADRRARALESGGELASDQSVLLPAMVGGRSMNFVIRPDGDALVSIR